MKRGAYDDSHHVRMCVLQTRVESGNEAVGMEVGVEE